jgi:hypothetical protein
MKNNNPEFIKEVLKIKNILNINEDNRSVRLIDILINLTIGKLKMVYFDDGDEIGEYYWIVDDGLDFDYSSMTHSDYLEKYGYKHSPFYKNPWGMLWINDCNFYNAFKENVFSNDDPVGDYDKMNTMLIEYFNEKYGVKIKKVSSDECY